MIKTILGSGFALALLAQVAHAQPASSGEAPPPPPAAGGDHQGDGRMHPASGDHEAGDWADQDGDTMGHGHSHRLPPSRPWKAARFRIENGDMSIGMTCPEDEPLKACEDFTLQLLDKLGSMPKH